MRSQLTQIVSAVFFESMDERVEEITRATHVVAGEARTIEGRLSNSDWLVGEHVSAADMVVFPGIMLLLRAMEKREAATCARGSCRWRRRTRRSRRWIERMSSLPAMNARIRRIGATVLRVADRATGAVPRRGRDL